MTEFVDDKDTSPMLGEGPGTASVQPDRPIKQPKCRFVIEPVLFFSATFGFPRLILDPLFMYYKVAIDLKGNSSAFNFSDLTAKEGCNHTNAFLQEVQIASSTMFIYRGIANSVPAFFVALFLGAYSDKKGRKYALVTPLVFECLSLILTVAMYLFSLPTWVFYLVSLVEGIGGNYQTMLLGCFAYVADTVPPENRAFRITVVEMLMFSCGILSYVGIGYWVEIMGFLWPYVLVLTGKALVMLGIVFLVPETVTPDPRASLCDTDHLVATARIFISREHPRRWWKLVLLLVTFFLPTMVVLGERVDTLFVMAPPVCFGAEQIGQYGAISIACIAVGGVVGAKVFKLCLPDIALAMISSSFAIAMDIYKVFISSPLMMWFVPLFALLTGFFIPTLRAIMSNLVTPQEHGSLFGSIACIEVLCALVGVSVFNAIYSATYKWMHAFVFLVNCFFYGAGLVLLIVYYLLTRSDTKKKSQEERPSEVSDHAINT